MTPNNGSEPERNFHFLRKGTACFPALAAAAAAGGLGGGIISWIFFRSRLVILPCLAAGAVTAVLLYRRHLAEKRTRQLKQEWKEGLGQLLVCLRSGRSLESAFSASLEDMDASSMPNLYPQWQQIVREIRLGYPVEESLRQTAQRTGLAEMGSFARSVEICKRTEGDVARVMEHTITVLKDRLEMQNELSVLLARKRLEQRLMTVMPFVILGLLVLLSPGYLSPLYDTLQGRLVMTVCAGLMVLSMVLSRKISHIEL